MNDQWRPFQLSLEFQFATKAFEGLKQLTGIVITLFAICAQRLTDDLLKLSGGVRKITSQRRRVFLKDGRRHLYRRVASERRMPGYHFVENHTETPNISAFINRRAARLLRRHVTGSSQYRSTAGVSEGGRFRPVRRNPWHAEALRRRLSEGGFGKFRNPKVENLCVSVRSKHDVFRLDIAVDNAGFVRREECTRHLDGDIDNLTELDRSAPQTLT